MGLRAESDPNGDLPLPLRDPVRDDAVESHRGNQQGD